MAVNNPSALTVEGLELQQVRLDLLVVLDDVTTLAGMVEALTDTGQRRLGIMTPAAEEAANAQTRAERRDRRRAQSLGLPTGTGDVRSPGNFGAIAAAVQIWATLTHQIRRCSRHLHTRQVCSLARLPIDPTHHDLARVLAHHALAVTDPNILTAALEDLAELAEETQRFVDAVESSTPVNADCPHCGRRTLVARFHEDLIRCERDPRTRHFEHCICSDPLCECKSRPISFRHVWHRPRPGGSSPTWYALRDRITITRLTGKEPHS